MGDSPMNTCRRFNLGDAMILIAATAGGCALARLSRVGFTWNWHNNPAYNVGELNRLGHYFFIALIPAYLAVRLRQPRPSLRMICRQPGMVACSAVLITFSLNTFPSVIDLLFESNAHMFISQVHINLMAIFNAIV